MQKAARLNKLASYSLFASAWLLIHKEIDAEVIYTDRQTFNNLHPFATQILANADKYYLLYASYYN